MNRLVRYTPSPVSLFASALLLAVPLVYARAQPATPAHSASGATCGNGLLETGESCESCATDCVVRLCKPRGRSRYFVVRFTPAPAMRTSSVTLQIAYRSDRISLPGTGASDGVRKRMSGTPAGATTVFNDLDYALRVVMAHPDELRPGPLLTLSVDGCKGAPAPVASDFACTVVGCASSNGDIEGCTCSVAAK